MSNQESQVHKGLVPVAPAADVIVLSAACHEELPPPLSRLSHTFPPSVVLADIRVE